MTLPPKFYSKILIIGCPGAGKTTLSHKISEQSNLPITHLDHLYWQPKWIRRDIEESDRLTDY
jgi:adenylate kinase family enzyme